MDDGKQVEERQVGCSLPGCWAGKSEAEGGALVVETREQGLRRAKALLRKYIPEGVNLSDELIAERRAEAARESEPRQ